MTRDDIDMLRTTLERLCIEATEDALRRRHDVKALRYQQLAGSLENALTALDTAHEAQSAIERL